MSVEEAKIENSCAPYQEPPALSNFYMVAKVSKCGDKNGFWIMPNNAPSQIHPTEEEARSEAMRLAKLHPYEKFVILESKRYVMARVDLVENHL